MVSTAAKKNETTVSQRTTEASSTSSSDDDLATQLRAEEKAKALRQQKKARKSAKKHKKHEVKTLDKYQIQLSLSLLMTFVIADQFEATSPYVHKFIHMQNRYPGTNFYDIDIYNDLYFVFTGILIATFVRAFTMNYILRPLAHAANITSSKAIQRFMEQGWCVVYYSISLGFGSYIYYNSPYFMNFNNFYIGWPHDKMTWLYKAYYLTELAGWLQQIFTLNIEERRKDHWQMFMHHIITCLLVSGSYYYYFTRIGNVIMVIMDVVDIMLSTAKILRYIGFQTVCDYMFGLFVISWILLRHGLYNMIVYHAATKADELMPETRCIPGGPPVKRCWNETVIGSLVVLLLFLQILMVIWMYLIAKVAIKVVTGNGAEDVRSDDDEDDE